jgi:hypothetical protein
MQSVVFVSECEEEKGRETRGGRCRKYGVGRLVDRQQRFLSFTFICV